jgi:ABC-type nitrate/sulfonate/bicarbonate transport system substrate-binding protein
MKSNWKKGLAAVLAGVLMVGLSACGAGGSSSSTELKKVKVLLDYVPNTNHTGMYVALDKGYYKDAGLDVEIVEPTDGAVATLIAQGQGDYGISYQEDVTVARTSADPLPIKAIATIIQHNTSGFATLKNSGITSPAAFAGKTYAGWGGPGETAVLKAVMNQAGADFNKLNVVTADGTGFEALGKSCDIMWFFEGWDVIQAQMHGVDLNYMPCASLDSRLDYYTPVIIGSDQGLKDDPDKAKAFLAATAKGYRYAIDHPDDAAEILSSHAPDYDVDFLKKSQEYLAGQYMKDTSTWGEMKDETWDNYTNFLVENGVISQSIPASQCYTNDYLK